MDNSETWEIIIGVCVLIGVYVLTRRYHAWRMARAYKVIIKDLEQKEAVNPFSAVELPYSRQKIVRIGTRDYRPKMLQYMTGRNIVGVTADGRYYLSHPGRGTDRPEEDF
ncbi:MAG: hypothetical protein K9N21_23330 [Deltaproteobacteria bacterium]|nr:hypothetical protein [Deltaproteobacteria bacterium]